MPTKSRRKAARRDPSEAKRTRALDLVVAGRSSAQVAEELGVTRRTVTRWRGDPEFDEQLRERQSEVHDAVHAALVARSKDVADALGNIALDGEAPAMARVHAIRTYFELLGRHKNAPVAPREKGADPETEEDLMAVLAGVPLELLRKAVEDRERPRERTL